MKVDVVMPKMGESLNEGTIIAWLKSVGDVVKKDEIIYEITTDKVDTEIPSPVAGVLTEIKVKENETVPVDTVVAVIESDVTVVEKGSNEKNEEEVKIKSAESEKSKPEKKNRIKTNKFLSPLVLSIAGKENIPISEVEKIEGTGVNGRISKNDILNYISKNSKSSKNVIAEAGNDEIIPMDNTRKKIMQHMIKSRDTAVHVTSVAEVDMSKIYDFLKKNKKRFLEEEKIKFTYMTFISHAVINAIKEFPLINSQIDGENIILKKHVNLGIAVAVEPNGLIVPNIKHAEDLTQNMQ